MEFHVILMSADDSKRVAKIISNVPGVSSPQQAVSWALSNVSIPQGTELKLYEWEPADPDALDRYIKPPRTEGIPLIKLPPMIHKTGIFKIDVSNLAGLKGSAIMEAGVLKQIAPSPSARATVLQGAKSGFLK